jgi:hypothetical protein
MRDHRTRSAALQARFSAIRQRVPEVRRVLLLRRAVPARPVPGVDRAVHLAFVVSISAPRIAMHLRAEAGPAPAAAQRAGAPAEAGGPASTATPGRVVRVVTAYQRAQSEASPERTVQARTAARVEAPRRSARVVDVQRVVVPRARTMDHEAGPAVATASAPEWPPPRPTLAERGTGAPYAPGPAELASITDSVMTAIDQRLIAYGERLGRA